MVGYTDNHTRDTYNLYNPETKKFIMTRYVKWVDWKMTDPAENLNMFRKSHKEYLVTGIEEGIIPMSEPEDNIPMHIIPDEGEIVRPDENSEKSSELMYHKKDSYTDTSSYGRLLNSLKKIDTSHNPTM